MIEKIDERAIERQLKMTTKLIAQDTKEQIISKSKDRITGDDAIKMIVNGDKMADNILTINVNNICIKLERN